MKKSILNLFGFNPETLPDSSFTENDMQANFKGDFFKDYSKKFKDNNFAIFDQIEVRIFGSAKNVTFKCRNFNKINLYGFRKLINTLNRILGPDSEKRERYCTQDFRDIYNKELELLSVRTWNLENLLLNVDLSFDRADNSLSLIIYGVGALSNASVV